MAGLDKFVDINDRYLEVSNVYSQRINQVLQDRASALRTQTERSQKLIEILESVDLRASGAPVATLSPVQAKGQSIVPTPDVLQATKKYQDIVLERFTKGRSIQSPRNTARLVKTLRLPPDQFLACFKSVSYAWDILVELASISVLPDTESLAARDMVFMHCAELESHLRAVVVQSLLARPSGFTVKLNCSIHINDLLQLKEQDLLVERAIEGAVPRAPEALLSTLSDRLGLAKELVSPDFDEESNQIVSELKKKENNFAELLDEGCKMDEAKEIADTMVSFGLRVGYGVWFISCENDTETRNSLKKNILFCTRILLDEGRWRVCRDIARVAIQMGRKDNEANGVSDPYSGTYMLKANWFWCRRKLGDDIRQEVSEWDTSDIHQRYNLLKMVLLDRHQDAFTLAKELLMPEPDTGASNMCMEEFNEWPILEEFRKTKEFQQLATGGTS